MPTQYWRSPETIDHLNRLERPGFAVEFLRRNAEYRREYAQIQRQIARVLEMRRIPRLVWIYDDSVEKAADLDLLIREARARDRAINPHADDTPPETETETDETNGTSSDADHEGA